MTAHNVFLSGRRPATVQELADAVQNTPHKVQIRRGRHVSADDGYSGTLLNMKARSITFIAENGEAGTITVDESGIRSVSAQPIDIQSEDQPDVMREESQPIAPGRALRAMRRDGLQVVDVVQGIFKSGNGQQSVECCQGANEKESAN